jgi:heme exporter protein D
MRWESWSQFWHMGGYAVYVWGSVGVTALLMAVEVWQASWAHRLALRQVQTEQAVAQLLDEASSVEKVM